MKKARRHLLIWLTVTLSSSLYFVTGYLASRPVFVEMSLEPNASVNLTVLRPADDRLRMALIFRGDHLRRRSELGEWSADDKKDGFLRFAAPGNAIRLVASVPHASPVIYEAMPVSAYNTDQVVRQLTSDLSVGPGVWRWPPHDDDAVLRRGLNTVNIKVDSVEPPLVNERIVLLVRPPLSFKETSPDVSWLWWWVVWPIVVPVELLWAAALGILTWRRS
jgi:hypothetical protein